MGVVEFWSVHTLRSLAECIGTIPGSERFLRVGEVGGGDTKNGAVWKGWLLLSMICVHLIWLAIKIFESERCRGDFLLRWCE
jgi:hypothetical protein